MFAAPLAVDSSHWEDRHVWMFSPAVLSALSVDDSSPGLPSAPPDSQSSVW